MTDLTLTVPGDARMPVIFAGHGSPINAIEDGHRSRGFSALRHVVPTPAAMLAISAHWYMECSSASTADRPSTHTSGSRAH